MEKAMMRSFRERETNRLIACIEKQLSVVWAEKLFGKADRIYVIMTAIVLLLQENSAREVLGIVCSRADWRYAVQQSIDRLTQGNSIIISPQADNPAGIIIAVGDDRAFFPLMPEIVSLVEMFSFRATREHFRIFEFTGDSDEWFELAEQAGKSF
ncbi:MAG: hypothetical protein PHY30_03295 [Candidatus Pacebacteria bacterium]|nr:hypothetical protein [Candidatus Paceibacterota bacterium]